MSAGIKVSKKHGVNPTLAICAWCGKETGAIALLGKLPGDAEAPMHAIIDYEPCDECKKQWAEGVAIIEVSRTPICEGQMPIANGAYPTGSVVVVKEEALNGGFKKGSKALMLTEEFRKMFGGSQHETD